MVNVSEKSATRRSATATGFIQLNALAMSLLSPDRGETSEDKLSLEYQKALRKIRGAGNVLTVAQLAGIMAAKSTSSLIPLCHPLPLTHVSVILKPTNDRLGDGGNARVGVWCEATVRCEGKTGVEMEALTAVMISLLTIWDMVKAVSGKCSVVEDVCVIQKAGGASGDWTRET